MVSSSLTSTWICFWQLKEVDEASCKFKQRQIRHNSGREGNRLVGIIRFCRGKGSFKEIPLIVSNAE